MPRILLADCDAMFCAVARLEDPEFAGKAALLIVGGRKESRGVVLSASYEARVYGVRSGMPIARAARLCPGAVFVPVPRHACGRKSREVRAVLEEWAPVVEQASIDEFYLGLAGTEALYRHEPLQATAHRIRADVLERTGLPVSFGGGSNRLVAKLAVERAKPRAETGGDGVFVVPDGAEARFVAELDLAVLPGVGPRLADTLRKLGLVHVRAALGLDREELQRVVGARTGAWLYDRIRGIAGERVVSDAPAKSVSRENTFGEDLVENDAIEAELVRLTTRVCSDLRRAGLRARTVSLKLRDFDFRTRGASRTLPHPVSTDRAVLPVARELLARLRAQRRVPVRLLGVAFTQLGAGPDRQLGFFAAESPVESDRDRRVAETVDRIEQRFGSGSIKPGRLLGERGGG